MGDKKSTGLTQHPYTLAFEMSVFYDLLRKCLQEGKDVTRCSNNFFRMVKKSCAAEFTQYAMCLEKSSADLLVKCSGLPVYVLSAL